MAIFRVKYFYIIKFGRIDLKRKRGIGKSFFGKKHEKLAHLRILASKIFHDYLPHLWILKHVKRASLSLHCTSIPPNYLLRLVVEAAMTTSIPHFKLKMQSTIRSIFRSHNENKGAQNYNTDICIKEDGLQKWKKWTEIIAWCKKVCSYYPKIGVFCSFQGF